MDIKKVSPFSGINSYQSAANNQKADDTNNTPKAQPSSEAVKLSDSFRTDSSREAKIQQLKEQVQNGSYGRSSEEVAGALYRELF